MSDPKKSKELDNKLVVAGLATGVLVGTFFWKRIRTIQNRFINSKNNLRRSTALITGASSGIGEAFARQLAALGYDLVLVARREDRLRQLAAELKNRHGISIEVRPTDLADESQIEQLASYIQNEKPLEILINCAGFGTRGLFSNVDITSQVSMIHVHVLAAVRLTHAALPAMIAQQRGAIINVSSVAGFFPLPGNISYSPTKAYLNMFSEILQTELLGTGIYVQALCPGYVYSEFHDTKEYVDFERTQYPRFMWTTANQIVEKSLNALGNGPTIYIPNIFYRLLVGLVTNNLLRPLIKLFIRYVMFPLSRHRKPLPDLHDDTVLATE